jgi:hypothetical protein
VGAGVVGHGKGLKIYVQFVGGAFGEKGEEFLVGDVDVAQKRPIAHAHSTVLILLQEREAEIGASLFS